MVAEVEIAAGRLRGVERDGVIAFKGVPYGASTADTNRFLPPKPPAPWAGVREATAYHAQAPQSREGFARRPELRDFASPPDSAPESEDCLTLNVWTPGRTGRRPVMVWFHGGAFAFGSSNSARLEGTNLCRRNDVVLVTVNQRLNVFGFLDLSEALGGEYAASGNAGTLDMVAALEWVRDTIAGFGGDPGNVTIFGESGGGAKVSTLLAMPRARGLFHRAIVQSGAAIRLRERERALRLTDALLRALGIAPGDAAALRRAPMRALLAAIPEATRAIGPSPWPLLDRYPFGPVVDGDIVPRHPFDPDAPEVSADIPLIVGDTRDEATAFVAHDDRFWDGTLTMDELGAALAPVAGERTKRVIATYARLHPDASPARLYAAALSDGNFRLRSLLMAERRARQGRAPVWMYSFAWVTPAFGGRLGSPHAIDVPFTFDTTHVLEADQTTPGATALAAAMSGAWAEFARSGRPGHPALPAWPAYDTARRATMILDETCRVADDPGAATRALWTEIAGAA